MKILFSVDLVVNRQVIIFEVVSKTCRHLKKDVMAVVSQRGTHCSAPVTKYFVTTVHSLHPPLGLSVPYQARYPRFHAKTFS